MVSFDSVVFSLFSFFFFLFGLVWFSFFISVVEKWARDVIWLKIIPHYRFRSYYLVFSKKEMGSTDRFWSSAGCGKQLQLARTDSLPSVKSYSHWKLKAEVVFVAISSRTVGKSKNPKMAALPLVVLLSHSALFYRKLKAESRWKCKLCDSRFTIV